jgi:23S rRNA pseudouridine1911/1915/1917 synthase
MQIQGKQPETKKAKSKEISLVVTEASELMKFLIEQMQDKSRNTIKSLLIHKQVSVDKHVVSKYNYPLLPGQQVKITQGKKVEEIVKYHGLKILFEDPYIIVIEKDAGLLSIATEKERRNTAYFILTEHVRKTNRSNRVYVVHRLDKDASGVMMFAKSMEMQETLQRNWEKAKVDRRYAVLVEGKMENEEGTHVTWLKESSALIVYSYNFDNGGQKAITHYKVIKSNEEYSLLEVKIDTGRKNQIRVHMKDLGHSIVGDKKYGSTQNPIRRMGLHARSLAFQHPSTSDEMHFETNIPNSFLSIFNR